MHRGPMRLAGLQRWLTMLVGFTASAGFLIWLVVGAVSDVDHARHDVLVTATVEDSAPYDDEPQYLLAFTIGGQPDEQWAVDVGRLTKGSTVAVLVDRRDHSEIVRRPTFATVWVVRAIQLVATAIFFRYGCRGLSPRASQRLLVPFARLGQRFGRLRDSSR